jgi:hypothetical protein
VRKEADRSVPVGRDVPLEGAAIHALHVGSHEDPSPL